MLDTTSRRKRIREDSVSNRKSRVIKELVKDYLNPTYGLHRELSHEKLLSQLQVQSILEFLKALCHSIGNLLQKFFQR
jgi:hypothetical protein